MEPTFTLARAFIVVCGFTMGTSWKIKREVGVDRNSSATIIFAGDMSFDGAVKYFAEKQKSCNYSSLFTRVKPLLMDADLRVGNLESPLLRPPYRTQPVFQGKGIHHFGSTEAVAGLKSAGFNVMQIANNHFVDYGIDGAFSTLKALREAGIDYVGLRERSMRQQKPLIKIVNGIKIGFLAYCLNKEGCELFETDVDEKSSSYIFDIGPNAFSKKIAGEDINDLKKRVDIVVVLMHWSRELSLIPPLGIRNLARSMSIFGANLIIGTHPHVIQGHECTGVKALTVYSLGNFIFRRNGVDKAFEFLEKKRISRSDVKEYIKQMRDVYSATQMGYMFRISVTRKGIKSAGYIPFEVRNEPKTNCLQPTPLIHKWKNVCDKYDSYCTDFLDVYSSGEAGLKESLDRQDDKFRSCILE